MIVRYTLLIKENRLSVWKPSFSLLNNDQMQERVCHRIVLNESENISVVL